MTLFAPAEPRRCNQCWKSKSETEFVSKTGRVVQDCADCRTSRGTTRATRRGRVDTPGLRVAFTTKSRDAKLGGIPSSYTSGSTCPDTCAFKDAGCYAEFGFVRNRWQRTSETGATWGEFTRWVRELPEGQLWRHNVAGDLPGEGARLDVVLLALLVQANRLRRGFTFTHKPLVTRRERSAVAQAVRSGFVINLSADSLEDADRLSTLGIAPVAVTLPHDAPRFLKTPQGRKVVVCPAQAAELDCARCRLCANADRTSIVGFRAHGQWKGKINRRLSVVA